SAVVYFSFFFQAEDGIRDFHVTGVQTCALPICVVGQNAAVGHFFQGVHRLRPQRPGRVGSGKPEGVFLKRHGHVQATAAVLKKLFRFGSEFSQRHQQGFVEQVLLRLAGKGDRKSTRLNSSHVKISYAVFCLKKKKQENESVGSK